MKVYLINWGYYSCNDNSPNIEAIYSTYEKAFTHIGSNEIHNLKGLKQSKNRKTDDLINLWSDGDYWVSIEEGFIDSPSLYRSKEEYEELQEEETSLDMTSVTRAEVPGTGKTMDELRREEE